MGKNKYVRSLVADEWLKDKATKKFWRSLSQSEQNRINQSIIKLLKGESLNNFRGRYAEIEEFSFYEKIRGNNYQVYFEVSSDELTLKFLDMNFKTLKKRNN